jgi:hypothetical protein
VHGMPRALKSRSRPIYISGFLRARAIEAATRGALSSAITRPDAPLQGRWLISCRGPSPPAETSPAPCFAPVPESER